MLLSVFPRLATDSAGRVFPGVWKPFFLKFPSRDRLPFPGWSSLPTSFVSFFVFYIFSYLFLKPMICFAGCPMSSASIQKLFCGIYSALKCSFDEFLREKVVSPSYSSAIFPSLSSKFRKLSSGHRTGKGQFSFQSQRKAMPKNAQTTTQLHSSRKLVK